jgi:hypothetical protein
VRFYKGTPLKHEYGVTSWHKVHKGARDGLAEGVSYSAMSRASCL